MGWKKMILGEQMPDKDDPKYRQRYEKEVNAGRKFAIVTGIDKLAATVQKGLFLNYPGISYHTKRSYDISNLFDFK